MRFAVAAAFCLWLGARTLASAQTLEISPARVMFDEPAVIRAKGFEPNERITISAELEDGNDHRWASRADFIADEQGSVDASKQAPVAGSYKEISAMGLIWSMRPFKNSAASYQAPKSLGPQTIEFHLLRKREQVSSATLEQVTLAEGVERIPVRDQDLRGFLFVPAGGGRKPGVLVLGGSEGGVPTRQAAWLASHGFAALALGYFRFEDLPAMLEAIPLEYFGRALAWMSQRPEIAGARLAVVGTSRGGELALQLGSMYPRIGAVVAYVPANVRYPACCGSTRVPYAWTWQGNPLAYVSLRLSTRPWLEPRAAIAVETTKGPILLISGQDDGVWRSSAMADGVVARLKQNHFPYEYQQLKYAHAGHMAGKPGFAPAWHGRVRHPLSGREMNFGGSPEGNAQSSLDATPKVIEFLRRSFEVSGTGQEQSLISKH
jgi:dienelactone hydrolase